MKKALAILMSTLMLAGMLTGCGGSSGSTGSASSDSTGTASADTGSSGTAVKIQLAHADTESEDGIHQKMATLFRDYVSELSEGSIEIEIVGNGQLGGERDLVEGMQLGTIEMASTANMVLSNFDARFSVLDLPYLITNYETAYKVQDE